MQQREKRKYRKNRKDQKQELNSDKDSHKQPQSVVKDLKIQNTLADFQMCIPQFSIPIKYTDDENPTINMDQFIISLQKHVDFLYKPNSYVLNIFVDASQTYHQIYPPMQQQAQTIKQEVKQEECQSFTMAHSDENFPMSSDQSPIDESLNFDLINHPTSTISYQKCTEFPISNWRNTTTIFFQIISEKNPKKRRKRNMPNQKRLKERGIVEVIELVQEWRRLHKESGNLNLDQIAAILHVSRKTMDDYSLQLRKAEISGFNFQKHKKDKMGVLRTYVKKHYQKDSKQELKKEENDERQLIKQEECEHMGVQSFMCESGSSTNSSNISQNNYENNIDAFINFENSLESIETFLVMND